MLLPVQRREQYAAVIFPVKHGLVSNVKYGKRSKTAKRRAPAVRIAARSSKATVTVEQLIEVKRFVATLGGAE